MLRCNVSRRTNLEFDLFDCRQGIPSGRDVALQRLQTRKSGMINTVLFRRRFSQKEIRTFFQFVRIQRLSKPFKIRS